MVTSTQSAANSSAVFAALNGGSATTSTTSAAQASQDRFMKLLVTQLKNQDPLNPMDNAQMTSQIAQINTVSGINQLNTTLQALAASMTPNQTVQAAGMIGHGVLVPGSSVDLATGGVGLGGFSLPTAADSATVSIYNSSGALINTVTLGAQTAGIVKWQWDGKDNTGVAAPAGSYTFKVTATLAGSSVAATNLQYGLVNSVTQGTAGLTLNVGSLQNVALTQVQQIL